jgi:hypothetical protein
MIVKYDNDFFPDSAKKSYFELLCHLFVGIKLTDTSNGVDWDKVEGDLGVVLPLAYKNMFSIFSGGYLGCNLLWRSPNSKRKSFRLDRRELCLYSDLFDGEIPLYPKVPGYLIFASTPLAIDLAFYVDSDKTGVASVCRPNVVALDNKSGDIEDADMEVDEFIYRAITNTPPLNGRLYGHIHEWCFSDITAPICRFYE